MFRKGPGLMPKPEPEEEATASPAEPRLDKVEQWRFDKLLAAGFTETQSLWLSLDRNIDLHDAVALRKKTAKAFRILS